MLHKWDFNPHSRKGSDREDKAAVQKQAISIHTPAKGVTKIDGYAFDGMDISIHTPAKGVTLLTEYKKALTEEFQSTLPQRE